MQLHFDTPFLNDVSGTEFHACFIIIIWSENKQKRRYGTLKFFKTLENHCKEARAEHHYLATMFKNISNANDAFKHYFCNADLVLTTLENTVTLSQLKSEPKFSLKIYCQNK